MTDYIASLNTPLPAVEPSNDFDDANIFATTDFFNFDFDTAPSLDTQRENNNTSSSSVASWNAQSGSTDFLSSGDFQFNPLTNVLPGQTSNPLSSTTFPVDIMNIPQSAPTTSSSSNSAKRKAVDIGNPKFTMEERTRLAAEEDKRRRNTAASARFRVKKKQREQQLEKTAKEMTEKVTKLEQRVNELEMENRWLKGLITDKNEGDGDKLSEMFAKVKEELGEKGLDALSELFNDNP